MSAVTVVTDDPVRTRAVAAMLAAVVVPGDVVALSGDLGAGKTCFVQGAAAALGVDRAVTSPTFMLVKTYPEARVPLVHADVYRLQRLHDVLDLGEDVFSPDAVTFLEWADAVEALLPVDRLDVELRLDAAHDRRTIVCTPHGSWQGRVPDLSTAGEG